jgi:hypothetical protein
MRTLITNPDMMRTMMTPENINAAMNLMGPGGAGAGLGGLGGMGAMGGMPGSF